MNSLVFINLVVKTEVLCVPVDSEYAKHRVPL